MEKLTLRNNSEKNLKAILFFTFIIGFALFGFFRNTFACHPCEPYCGDGILDPDEECEIGWECMCPEGTVCNTQTCLCEPEEPEPSPLTIIAYKVICESEEDLPNWGLKGLQLGEPEVITADTAADYVANSQGRCFLASGWEFQWGPQGQKQQGDYIGPAPEGTGWNDFDSSTGEGGIPAKVEIYDLQEGTSKIWVRENLQEGYIPFANPPGSLQNDISAEMWCHDDILNFDNYDYIKNPQLGETYYCVAFNALVQEPEPVCGNGILEEGEECEISYECACPEGTVCNLDTCLCEQQCDISGVKFYDENQNGINDEEQGLSGWTIQLKKPVACEEGEEWADEVIEYNQGTKSNGDPLDIERTDSSKALGPAQYNDTLNFVSLGFGGSLVLKFDNYIINGAGNDIEVVETSYGSPSCTQYPEKVHVFASQTGADGTWEDLGIGCLDSEFDLNGLAWAKYLKLEDVTDPNDFTGVVDGFDVDGVKAIHCISDWEVVDSDITDENGNYCFNSVEPGDYRIEEVLQSGWINSTPLYQEITFGGEEPVYVDFGNYQEETEPVCGNGILEPGEECEVGYDCCPGYVCNTDTCLCEPEPGPVCGNGIVEEGEECDDGNNENGDGCSADCMIEEECESFLKVHITYFANYDPEGAIKHADMSDYVYVGNDSEPFGQTLVVIPLTTDNRTNPIIDPQVSSFQDDVPGLHIQRGENETGLFVEISAYGFNHKETRESVKADIEFINALIDQIQNGPDGGYEKPDTQGCGIVEGDPQNDKPGNDEYNFVSGENTGDICSITNVHRDRVRLYYQPTEECSAPVCGNGVLEGEEQCEIGYECACPEGTVCNLDTCLCEQETPPGPVCGNGIVEEGEECDDGNNENGDGCSADCMIEEECEPGEQRVCDTGQLGICSAGTQTCTQDGFWGECVPDSEPIPEVCDNQLDDDCDGYTDCDDEDCAQNPACEEGPECTNYYKDSDQDGYGVTGDSQCLTEPSGDYTATQDGDCDDTNSAVNPGATEICDDGIDNDCDGDVDDNDSDCQGSGDGGGGGGGGGGWTTGTGHGCIDTDQDGYYAYSDPLCLVGDDCDDSNSNINPGASEVCDNQLDDDCDGYTDCDDEDCAQNPVCTGEGGQGAGGRGGTTELRIFNEYHFDITEDHVIVNWQTNLDSTSQIIYSGEDEPHNLDESSPPYYGYAHAYPDPADTRMVSLHSIFVPDLKACTTYYYRIVSSASPPVFSPEYSFSTLCKMEETFPSVPEAAPAETEGGPEEVPPAEEGLPEEEVVATSSEEEVVEEAEAPEEEMMAEVVQPAEGNFFANLLASIGGFFSGMFGGACLCLPCWSILVFAGYSLLKAMDDWRKLRKKQAKIWFIWMLLLVVLTVLCYLQTLPFCVNVWIFILLGLISFFLSWYFQKKEKVI